MIAIRQIDECCRQLRAVKSRESSAEAVVAGHSVAVLLIIRPRKIRRLTTTEIVLADA